MNGSFSLKWNPREMLPITGFAAYLPFLFSTDHHIVCVIAESPTFQSETKRGRVGCVWSRSLGNATASYGPSLQGQEAREKVLEEEK